MFFLLGMSADQKLTSQVHEIVGRINGRFGTLTTVPIHHLVCLIISSILNKCNHDIGRKEQYTSEWVQICVLSKLVGTCMSFCILLSPLFPAGLYGKYLNINVIVV